MAALSTLKYVYRFLFNHSDLSNIKYIQAKHPLISLICTTQLYMLFVNWMEQNTYTQMQDFKDSQSVRNYISVGILLYIALMIITRFTQLRNIVFYEMIWACNLSLFVSAYAIQKNSPLLLSASMLVISIDQVLWFVDIIGFLLFRKFPVGVAKYITWPQTTKLRLLTSFHHILFIPLCLYLLRNQVTIPFEAMKISTGMTMLLGLLSRMLVPHSIKLKTEDIYLNMNLSHELWKDIPIKLLKIADGKPWPFAVSFSVLMWNTGNYILGYKLLNLIRRLF